MLLNTVVMYDHVRRACVEEEEEIQSLQKTISQMEAELDEEQNRLVEATSKLENSEKQLAKVSHVPLCDVTILMPFRLREQQETS